MQYRGFVQYRDCAVQGVCAVQGLCSTGVVQYRGLCSTCPGHWAWGCAVPVLDSWYRGLCSTCPGQLVQRVVQYLSWTLGVTRSPYEPCNTIPQNTDALVPSRYEFKNSVAVKNELLYPGTFTNSHLHFLIVVESATSPVWLQRPEQVMSCEPSGSQPKRGKALGRKSGDRTLKLPSTVWAADPRDAGCCGGSLTY